MRNLLVMAMVAPLAACGGGRARDRVATVPVARQVEADVVPVGTRFTARLEEDLDTGFTRPGGRFSATVQMPLFAARGGVAVRAGARLHGQVLGTTPGRPPGLRLRLEAIDGVAGRVPVVASLQRITQFPLDRPVAVRDENGPAGVASVRPSAPMGAVGGGPPGEGRDRPTAFRLQRDAVLELVLAAPLRLDTR